MDLQYPLAYTSNGSIAIADTETTVARSQLFHLLDTVNKERYLYPDFGLPINVLFNSWLPEIIAVRIKVALGQLAVDYNVKIVNIENNRMRLEVTEAATGLVAQSLILQ